MTAISQAASCIGYMPYHGPGDSPSAIDIADRRAHDAADCIGYVPKHGPGDSPSAGDIAERRAHDAVRYTGSHGHAHAPLVVGPADLLNQLSELKRALETKDAQLEHSSVYRHRASAQSSKEFMNLARQLDDVREGVTQLLPHETKLHQRLGSDALGIAEQGGRVGMMFEHQRIYSADWASALDDEINDVNDAILALKASYSGYGVPQ